MLKSRQETVNDVSRGNPIAYKVFFPLQDPLPKPIAIYNNDQLLCTSPKGLSFSLLSLHNFDALFMIIEYANVPHTTITLDHTFVTGLSGSSPNQQKFFQPQNIYQPQTTTAPKVIYVQPPQTTPAPQIIYVQPPQPTRPPIYVQQTSLPQYQNFNSGERFVTAEFECGVTSLKPPVSTGLIINGQTANRGQFPW